MRRKIEFKKLILPLVLLIVLIAGFFLFSGFKLPVPDKKLQELRSIAEISPLIKGYERLTPTYRIYPDDPNKNTYLLDYFDQGSNSGISFWIDLNQRKIIKTQTVVGVN